VLNILFDVFIASLDYKTVKMSLLGAYCLVGANLFTNLNIFFDWVEDCDGRISTYKVL
jgi:hypothetical protein